MGPTAVGAAKAILCGGVVAALGCVALLAGVPLILTSWASSMALIVSNTHGEPAVPWRVAGGHLITGAVGLALVQLAGHIDLASLAASPAPDALVRAGLLVFAAVAGGVAAMMATRAFHPPAAANGVIMLVSGTVGPGGAVLLLGIGAVTLAAVASALRRLTPSAAASADPDS